MNSKMKKYNLKYEEPKSSMFQMLDSEGRVIYVNEKWLEETGYEKEEVIGKFFKDFLTEDTLPKVKKNFPHLRDYGFVDNVLLKLKRKDGVVVEAVLNGISIYDDEGEFLNTRCELKNLNYFMNSISDIKDILERERFLKGALHIKSQLNSAIVNSTYLEEFLSNSIKILEEPIQTGSVCIKDYECSSICSDELDEDLKSKLDKFLNDRGAILKAQKNKVVFFDNDDFKVVSMIKEKYGKSSSLAVLPIQVEKDGINKFFTLSIIFLEKLDSFEKEWFDFLEEIAKLFELGIGNIGMQEEMENLLKKLYKISTKDALTGVYNRYKFDFVLETQKKLFQENGTPFTLIMYDIDGFKEINDKHGHIVGDYTLKEVSTIVKDNIRGKDQVFRLGADEFVIVLPGADTDEACQVAERIKEEIFQHKFKVDNLTCSFGIAGIKIGDTLGNILKRVDMALCKSKKNGKNRISLL